MSFVRESVRIGDHEISIETGKWAKQASAAVVVRCGETMVLVTANGSKEPRAGMNFMPLTCEYKEKFYAAGKVPGSFFRREGRPSESEILVCRLMDRPARPLFPDGWRIDTQLIANVVSFDQQNNPDVLAMTGTSAALTISAAWDRASRSLSEMSRSRSPSTPTRASRSAPVASIEERSQSISPSASRIHVCAWEPPWSE